VAALQRIMREGGDPAFSRRIDFSKKEIPNHS
jgi:hypothetical protein